MEMLKNAKKLEVQTSGGKTNKVNEYCSVCKEPTMIIETGNNGIEYEVYRDCECVRNERTRLKINKFKNLWITSKENKSSFFGNVIHRTKDDEIVYNKLLKYSACFNKALEENIGIMLTGPIGTGKTFYASCIANAIQDELNKTVLSFNLSGYLRKIQDQFAGSGINEEARLLQAVKEVDLLIIDDLGSERLTEWGIEKVYNLIDERYRAKKPIIITTNMNKLELEEHLELNGTNKILDRIISMTHPIALTGESRRKKNFTSIFD